MKRLDVKYVVETVAVGFDFSPELAVGETLSGTPTVSASVYLGYDATPAAIITGSASKNVGNIYVTQAVTAGVAITDYLLTAVCLTSANRTLAVEAILPVR